MKWQKVSSAYKFKNRWLKVRIDQVNTPEGKKGEYSVLETEKVVLVAARSEADGLYLINLYRYPIMKNSWEVVKGRCDGDEPLVAAKRELAEETGLTAEKWTELSIIYPLSGLSSEENYLYLAEGLTQTGKNKQQEEGIRQVEIFSVPKIEEMIGKNEITDGQTIAALYKVKIYLEKNNG